MAAFSALRTDGTAVNDPRYLKWAAKFMKDDKIILTKILHPCRQEDMEKFFPAENQSTQEQVSEMVKEKILYCLPWQDEEKFDLSGAFTSSKYTALDVMLISCNSRIDDSDGKVLVGINDDCVEDKTEVQDYLSSKINLIYYYN